MKLDTALPRIRVRKEARKALDKYAIEHHLKLTSIMRVAIQDFMVEKGMVDFALMEDQDFDVWEDIDG